MVEFFHAPRKRFGQNFLTDQSVIDEIINALDIKPDDCVVEIGPGLGALTRPLIERLTHLFVVEIDRDIVARLRNTYAPKEVSIFEGDALSFDFSAIPCPPNKKLQIIGNLPYNISTPLLFHLATFAYSVKDMHFMLQKEVVDRLVAAPQSRDYGRLSVMLQYRFVMDFLFDVPPESFHPIPKVESAVVRFIPKPPHELDATDEIHLSKIVQTAFSQRRKMLRNTLKGIVKEEIFTQLGISPTARAEELSLADYVRLSNALLMENPG